jgi:hypothetical protein
MIGQDKRGERDREEKKRGEREREREGIIVLSAYHLHYKLGTAREGNLNQDQRVQDE